MNSHPKTKTKLPPGTKVKIQGQSRVYQVHSGPDSKGRYKLSLGEITLTVDGETLAVVKTSEKTRKKKKSQRPRTNYQTSATNQTLTLDLHGYTTPDAVRAMEQSLDRALLQGVERLEIIHGIGTGALKAAVSAYLSESKYVKKFSADPRNPGVIWAYLE